MSKPLWKGAPRWAMWLGQDNDGCWFWWENKPIVTGNHEDFWMPNDQDAKGAIKRARRSIPPADWTKTLEARP